MTLRKNGSKAGSVLVSPVKGGWVKREAASGQLLAVHGSSGTERARSKTVSVVKAASEKRSAALKRLADR